MDPKADQSSVMLTIFAANVDVELDPKLKAEIRRSTKKNPPCVLKYELIYVRRPIRWSLDILIHLPDGQGRVRCKQGR